MARRTENLNLQHALLIKLLDTPRVQVIQSVKVESIQCEAVDRNDWPLVHLSNDATLHARLLAAPIPFRDCVISTANTCIGVELCEELFYASKVFVFIFLEHVHSYSHSRRLHILIGLDAVEIFTNSSGSHHELRKLYTCAELIKEATLKVTGVPQYGFCQLTRLPAWWRLSLCQSKKAATVIGCIMMVVP